MKNYRKDEMMGIFIALLIIAIGYIIREFRQ